VRRDREAAGRDRPQAWLQAGRSPAGTVLRSARRRQSLIARPATNVNLDLVIFDCDGVLVDSEVISCRAHAETLTRHGYPITEEEVLHRFLGVSDREARLTIERETGRP